MPHKDPEVAREYHRRYNLEHYPAYYAANADGIRQSKRDKNRERVRAMREKAMDEYGGVCVCCEESDRVFLTFDHTNNDGAAHRREVFGRPGRSGSGGASWYRWLRDNDYPKDIIQLLCANCQLGKLRNGGICPHQEVKTP